MRITIGKKIFIIMLLVSVLPLITLGYFSSLDARHVGYDAADDARWMGTFALRDSTEALEELGVAMIEQKAEDVSKQIEIYLNAHPDATLTELQSDSYFKSIANQKIGDTGYTFLYEKETGITRFHPDERFVNYDMKRLKETLPEFWETFRPTLSGSTVGGYYDWIDSDGVTKRKFMYLKPVRGTPYMIGATVYTEEFSEPVKKIDETISREIDYTISKIKESTESLSMHNTILIITLITIFAALFVSFLFAQSITKPIRKLTEVADRVSMGELEDTDIEIKSDDEIGDLAESFGRMVVSLRYYMDKLNSK
jgi:methyl-accepting chemotaxis protein